jgi:hypothetical protein
MADISINVPFYATWRDPVYCARLHLIIDDDMARAAKTAKTKGHITFPEEGFSCGVGGATFERNDVGITIWMPYFDSTPNSIANLGHELIHACTEILKTADVRAAEGSDEGFAYLWGYEMETALTALIRSNRCRR